MNKRGFTLIELLIVIAIIAILAGVVFVALNPLARFQQARDAKRWGDVVSMINAVKVNQVDRGGSYLDTITALASSTNYVIGTGSTGCDTGCGTITTNAACVNLTGLVDGGYLGSIAMDPSAGTPAKTLYYLNKSNTGIIMVGACTPESILSLNVSR